MKIKLDEGAIMPERAHDDDAGLDIFSPIDKVVYPGCRTSINLGVHVEIPKGYVGFLKSKSGLMKNYGLKTDGTIDSGYIGPISVVVFNNGANIFHIQRGAKITQLVIVPCLTPNLEVVDDLEQTERGSNGFGSTGFFKFSR